MNRKFVFPALVASLVFASCQKDSPEPEIPGETDYSPGVLVLNEGNFGWGNASLTYYPPELDHLEQEIFQTQNAMELGDTGVDMSFNGDQAFIVMNTSNTIQVVNRHSFKQVSTITEGLKNPRAIEFHNGKAYVSNWGEGSDPNDDYIAVFDSSDRSLVKKIPVSEGPEEILAEGENVIIAHGGGWNFSDEVTFIDPLTNTVEHIIEVGDVPNSMVIANRQLYVLSGGKPAFSGEETPGSLTVIDLNLMKVTDVLPFETGVHPSHLQWDQGTLYYTVGKGVFGISEEEGTLPAVPLIQMEEVDYLYGFRLINDMIYATSANTDFTGNGKLLVYDLLQGVLQAELETGINPTAVFFNP